MSWIYYALLSGIMLGARTVCARLSQKAGLSAGDGVAVQTLAVCFSSLLIYIALVTGEYGKEISFGQSGVNYALSAGVLNAAAIVTMFLAVKNGYAPLVMVLAEVPVLLITLGVSPFIGDILNLRQYAAAAFLIIAAILAI